MHCSKKDVRRDSCFGMERTSFFGLIKPTRGAVARCQLPETPMRLFCSRHSMLARLGPPILESCLFPAPPPSPEANCDGCRKKFALFFPPHTPWDRIAGLASVPVLFPLFLAPSAHLGTSLPGPGGTK